LGIFEEIPLGGTRNKQTNETCSNKLVITDSLPKHISSEVRKTTNESSRINATAPTPNLDNSIDLNDIEQNRLFDWVRQERLPLFFRTDLFRDFKMCKLLTRSLNDYNIELDSSTASSQLIGGYSRQSRKSF
jgi:hypothetical protein